MRAFIALLLSLWFAPAWAQVPMTGAGKGTPGVAASYQGPGDVVSGATGWGSMARVYNLSLASTSTSLADLVASTGGAAVCTLRGSSTGYVDLSNSYCAGTTPAAACAAASGGSCKVTKIYDQIGATGGWTNATLASMPTVDFSGANGLPGIKCDSGNAQLNGVNTVTVSRPLTWVAYSNRTGNFTTSGGIIGTNTTENGLVSSTSTNQVILRSGGGAATNATASDSAYHSLIGLADSAVSASVIAVDGVGGATGTASSDISALTMRICRAGSGGEYTGTIMEVGLWPSGFNGTQRGDMNTNMHSSTYGYGP